MVMNKRGQGILVLLMLVVTFIILGLALAKPMVETQSYNMAQLDCGNVSISNNYKATCESLDIFSWIFTGIIFGIVGAIVGGMIYR
jgi:hypothetical protein